MPEMRVVSLRTHARPKSRGLTRRHDHQCAPSRSGGHLGTRGCLRCLGAGPATPARRRGAGAAARTHRDRVRRVALFRPRQVTHQPAPPGGQSSTVVQYGAQVRWAGGQVASETLVMATGGRIPRRAAVVDGDGVRVGIWRWPFDPDLPGLASAVDADTVSALLADLGMGGGKVRLTVRAYRPGRRAVIEASGSPGRVFLKVVRPHRVEALHAKHRLLARHLPVPHSYGYSTDGSWSYRRCTAARCAERSPDRRSPSLVPARCRSYSISCLPNWPRAS